MLQRSEVGTRGHILLWLAGKPEGEVYDWPNPHCCPAATYAKEHMGRAEWDGVAELCHDNEAVSLSTLARDGGQTWGALYQRASAAWQ
jgi:hypothetical protein